MSDESKIPPYLLEKCSEQEKWLMETVWGLNQKFGSIHESVDRIESLQKIANGRTSKNESSINILESQIGSWISFKESFFKVIKSKYFIIGAAIAIFLGLYPLAIYISKSGGVIQFAETIVKAIYS